MRFVLAFAIGFVPAASIAGWIAGGHPTTHFLDAFGFYVCPYRSWFMYPGALAIGYLVLAVIGIATRHRRPPRPGTAERMRNGLAAARTVASRPRALADFVDAALARGEPHERIVDLLTRNGWAEADVRDALAAGDGARP